MTWAPMPGDVRAVRRERTRAREMERKGHHGSLMARKVMSSVAIRVVTVGLLGVSSILTARELHPAGRGTYGVVLAFVWVAAALGHLSVEQSVVLRWQRGDDPCSIASTAVLIGLLAGCLAGLGGWIIALRVGGGSFSGHDRRLIVIGLPAVPLVILTGYLMSLHVLGDRLRRVNLIRSASAAAQLVALVVLIATGHLTTGSALLVWVLTLGAVPVLLLLPGLAIRPAHVSSALGMRLLRTGIRYHWGMAALFMLRRVDTLILNTQVSRREVGLYVVAVVLAELLFLPAETVAQAVLPKQVVGTLVDAADFTARVVRLNTIVGVVCALVLAVLSPVLVRVGYGAAFAGSVAPLLALLPGVATVGLIRPITAILVRLDRPSLVSLVCLVALVVNVALNFALIPTFGIVGASIASTVAYACQAVAYAVWLVRSTHLTPADLWPRRADLRLLTALPRRGLRPAPVVS